ncbi:MAG: ABC transporter ATP-binding protein [Spirochaetaceae bacterium]|nr:MAG: ABC transporter ATP-binding protein [Spirochaetaceae bacterium]
MNEGSMKDVSVRASDLWFSFGTADVLTGVSMEIRQGTFVSILGPNGCGKTTLLRAMAANIKPDKGNVLIEGRDVRNLRHRQRARMISCVRQEHEVAHDFTVSEMVKLGRSPHIPYLGFATVADKHAVLEAMEQTGMTDFAERRVNTLSGGELQRVFIAQALAQDAPVLLLDEPVSHLDIRQQYRILGLVQKLSREKNITVLAVLHDLNLAGAFSDRIALLHNGKVRAFGTPTEVLVPDTIKEVFGIKVRIISHPASGLPHVILDMTAGEDFK